MELHFAGPPETARHPVVRRWVRLRDREALDPMAELIAIGDALPPGAIRAMERRGPLSSINWSLTVLGSDFATRDGWWLLETASNHMADGFSSETLRLWNTDGVEVMRGLQSVAIFG
jgi:acyl-CoA thioesterase